MSNPDQNLDAETELNIKVYSRWAAYQLKHTEYAINDISKDLQDGILLLQLAKTLTKMTFPQNLLNKSLGKQNAVSKLDKAISMFNENGIIFGIKQNTICGEDIYNGNVKQILSLFWILIKNYSIDKAIREDKLFNFDKENMDIEEIEKKNSIQLLKWATNKIQSYANIEKNFKPYDLAICALLHSYLPKFNRPGEFDYDSLDVNNHDKNIQIAADFMEKQNIPVYIFAEDIKNNDYQVDNSSLMTQLSAIKIFLDKNFPYRDSVIGRNQNLYRLQLQKELKEARGSILAQEDQNENPDQLTSEKATQDQVNTENVTQDQINLENNSQNQVSTEKTTQDQVNSENNINDIIAKEIEKREKIWKEREEKLLKDQKEMFMKELEEKEKEWKEREEKLLREQKEMFLKLLSEKNLGQNLTLNDKSSHKKLKLVIRSKIGKDPSNELSLTDNNEDLSISPLINDKNGKKLKVKVLTDDNCLEKTYDNPTSGLKIVFHEGNQNKE